MTKTNGKTNGKIELRVSINEPWWRGFAAAKTMPWRTMRKMIRKQAIESVDESGANVVVNFVDSLGNDEYDIMFLAPGTDEEAAKDTAAEYGIRAPGGVKRRVGATLRDLQEHI
jgi:hypothetical protein